MMLMVLVAVKRRIVRNTWVVRRMRMRMRTGTRMVRRKGRLWSGKAVSNYIRRPEAVGDKMDE
eukprot:3160964-Pyramimonas_sp.AAC.1